VEVPTQFLQVKPSPQLRSTRAAHKDGVLNVLFSPDGKALASSGPQGDVTLWNVASLERRQSLPEQGQVLGLAFTPDGKRLLVPSYEPVDAAGKWLRPSYDYRAMKGLRGGVRLVDPGSAKLLGWLRRDPGRGVLRVSVTADGKTAAMQEYAHAGDDKQVRRNTSLWDMTTGKPRAEVPGDDVLYGMTHDGKTLVRVGAGGAVLWDIGSAKPRMTLTSQGERLIRCTLSRDGRTLAGAVYGPDGLSVRVWDMPSGKRLKQLKAGAMPNVLSLALSADGAWLATGRGGHSRTVEPTDVLVWNVKTGKHELSLRGHVNGVLALDFHPDGKLLATGGSDGTVRLWEVDSQRLGRR
jgi:WD40 repeat protein